MALESSHMFLSKINGKNISYDKLDYTVSGLYNRMKFIEDTLQYNDDFLMEYFDKYYKFNPNCWEHLSHNNNICCKLESMGTYILSQVPDKRKLEYKFYNGEKNFENVLKKEYSLDRIIDSMSGNFENQTDGDIMHFLEREENSWYLPKTIKVEKCDFERQDELGEILRQYKHLRDDLAHQKDIMLKGGMLTKKNCKINTTKLRYMIGSIDSDMLEAKTQILQPVLFTNTLRGSTKSDWSDVDFLNPIHVECFLKLTHTSKDFDDDLSLLLNYFNTILDRVMKRLTYEEKEILRVIRWGIKTVEKVNEALQVGYDVGQVKSLIQIDAKELSFVISHIVHIFIQEYYKDIQTYLDFKRDNSEYLKMIPTKVCKCCGKTKPLTSFIKKRDMKDGHRNKCKQCTKR